MVALPVKKRIGLALSGGATRGLAHLGVLHALEDHHMRLACLSGSSIGAFVAALYAFGVPIKEMRRIGQGMTPLNISNSIFPGMPCSQTKSSASLSYPKAERPELKTRKYHSPS